MYENKLATMIVSGAMKVDVKALPVYHPRQFDGMENGAEALRDLETKMAFATVLDDKLDVMMEEQIKEFEKKRAAELEAKANGEGGGEE